MAEFRILHTEWSDGWGGQERRIVSEMAGMRARGHRIWLATRASCRIAREAAAVGISVETLPFAGKFHAATIIGLMRLIRREGIDIVNTHSGIDSWTGGIAAKLAGASLVRTRHLDLPLRRHWFNFVHYLPDRMVTCGAGPRHNLVENFGFPAHQVVSIPTGIDLDNFRPRHGRAATRAALGLSEADFAILMVGVIRGVKQHDVALRAFAELRRTKPHAVLLLAGEGPMLEATQRLAVELQIDDAVRFLGHRDDVPDLLAAADCLLLTSRSEGVPQAITQALICAVPVVATAVGGVPELVIHEQTGLLVPPNQPAQVAEALSRLMNDPALAWQLGEAGQRHASDLFSLTRMLDDTERVYAEVLATKGSVGA